MSCRQGCAFVLQFQLVRYVASMPPSDPMIKKKRRSNWNPFPGQRCVLSQALAYTAVRRVIKGHSRRHSLSGWCGITQAPSDPALCASFASSRGSRRNSSGYKTQLEPSSWTPKSRHGHAAFSALDPHLQCPLQYGVSPPPT